MLCRHCGDVLEDAPSGVDTCRKWCAWRAHERGGMLTETEARQLELIGFCCAWEVAIDRGLELIPDDLDGRERLPSARPRRGLPRLQSLHRRRPGRGPAGEEAKGEVMMESQREKFERDRQETIRLMQLIQDGARAKLVRAYLAQVAPERDYDSTPMGKVREVLDKGFMAWLIAHPDREAVARFQEVQALTRKHLPREFRLLR